MKKTIHKEDTVDLHQRKKVTNDVHAISKQNCKSIIGIKSYCLEVKIIAFPEGGGGAAIRKSPIA